MPTLYRYAAPQDETEAADLMELLEDRGDRVLVRSIVYFLGWTVRPTFVYRKSELVEIHQ